MPTADACHNADHSPITVARTGTLRHWTLQDTVIVEVPWFQGGTFIQKRDTESKSFFSTLSRPPPIKPTIALGGPRVLVLNNVLGPYRAFKVTQKRGEREMVEGESERWRDCKTNIHTGDCQI
jgi:hypothetical protein